ncbi:ribonuclease P protein subunit [Candidatus Woesearchaeota archaeon]|nr:ribonuclease P protein subunit [Candidatus Woesearchaeota archaeon]
MRNTKEEFVGKLAEISYCGKTIKGTIIDETKNMIHLKTKTKTIKIIKKNAKITINGKTINGLDITKRPEDRIKAC